MGDQRGINTAAVAPDYWELAPAALRFEVNYLSLQHMQTMSPWCAEALVQVRDTVWRTTHTQAQGCAGGTQGRYLTPAPTCVWDRSVFTGFDVCFMCLASIATHKPSVQACSIRANVRARHRALRGGKHLTHCRWTKAPHGNNKSRRTAQNK